MSLSRILSKTGIIVGLVLMVETWPCYAAKKVRVEFVIPEDSCAKGIPFEYTDDMTVASLVLNVKQKLKEKGTLKADTLYKCAAIKAFGTDPSSIETVNGEDKVVKHFIDTQRTFNADTTSIIADRIASSRLSRASVTSLTFKSLWFKVLILNVTNDYTLADLDFSPMASCVVPKSTRGEDMEVSHTQGMTMLELLADSRRWCEDKKTLKVGPRYKYFAIEMTANKDNPSLIEIIDLEDTVAKYIDDKPASKSLRFKVFVLSITDHHDKIHYTLVHNLNPKLRDS